MGSLFLNALTQDQRKDLEQRLLAQQGGKCFICEKPINPDLHQGLTDIDHVEPLRAGGKDDPSNFAITHSSCNRSKQAADLRVARVIARFDAIREQVNARDENRGTNLGDVLATYGGSCYELHLKREGQAVVMSFPEVGRPDLVRERVYRDPLSGFEYFFAMIPIQYLFHDDRINPRAIGSNLRSLVEEFHRGRPQLHISLAWCDLFPENTQSAVKVFDGQHKAAAQVLLGVRELPARVFLNPDPDVLITTNTNAGTSLRQVAFDRSVQRHLGSTLFLDRVQRYRSEYNLPPGYEGFSEKDLVNHFRGEWREMKRYILDAIRDWITHNPENRLRDYIDFGGKAKERPFSYSSIEKTFYSFFIFQDALETPLDFRLDEGFNPRELEKHQILNLMNLIADELYVGKFDPALGTFRIENRVQQGEDVPEAHLRAYRMAKEEILYSWLRLVRQIAYTYFVMQGTPVQEDRLFQYAFPEPLWNHLENFVANLGKLPLWANRSLSQTVFGGKQNYDYWQSIFETGKGPQGQQVLAEGLNLMKMIQD